MNSAGLVRSCLTRQEYFIKRDYDIRTSIISTSASIAIGRAFGVTPEIAVCCDFAAKVLCRVPTEQAHGSFICTDDAAVPFQCRTEQQ